MQTKNLWKIRSFTLRTHHSLYGNFSHFSSGYIQKTRSLRRRWKIAFLIFTQTNTFNSSQWSFEFRKFSYPDWMLIWNFGCTCSHSLKKRVALSLNSIHDMLSFSPPESARAYSKIACKASKSSPVLASNPKKSLPDISYPSIYQVLISWLCLISGLDGWKLVQCQHLEKDNSVF